MAKDLKVTKSNTLVEAAYKLSLQEQRLILCALSKVNPRREVPKTISVSVVEFSEFVDMNRPNAHRELYKAADTLYERSITIRNSEKIDTFRWIQRKIQYVKGDGKITLVWSDEVLKYIGQLRNRFTTYKLKNITQLQSTYSIRLYELLMQFNCTGKRTISLNDLRTMFGIEDRYPQFKILNRAVIKPSVAELNQRSDLVITYETIKDRRNVVGLRFDFTQADQMKLPVWSELNYSSGYDRGLDGLWRDN